MVGRSGLALTATAVLCFCTGAAAFGQATERKATGGGGGGYNAVIDNIDMLVDNYARFLGRKYDLNAEQDDYTKKLMREKCYAFLNSHEDELRELFDKMFEVRTGGEISPDELASWGKRVMPIFEEAKKLVVSGNGEWREILNDQQKTIHDGDLKMMEESLKSTEDTLARIVNGEMTVEEFRNPSISKPGRVRSTPARVAQPQEASTGADPQPVDATVVAQAGEGGAVVGGPNGALKVRPRPALARPDAATTGEAAPGGPPGDQPLPVEPQPAPPVNPDGNPPHDGGTPPPQPEQPVEPQPQPETPPPPPEKTVAPKPPGKNYESEWEKYVREFIDKYKLDATQTQNAEQILKDSEAQADKYLSGKKSELETLEKRETELKAAPKAPKVSTEGGKPGGGTKAAESSRTTELAEITKKREAIMQPIGKIFEDGLKPKLEKIPTRAQRKAAEDAAKKAATAKPGKPSDSRKPATPAGKPGESSGKDKKP
jgi:hypothetical protein